MIRRHGLGVALLAVSTAAAVVVLAGCATSDPLDKVTRKYIHAPTYSVVLEDMEQSGTFFRSHRQRFNVIQEGSDGKLASKMTPWIDVNTKAFRRLAPYLGMTVLAKTAEGVVRTPFPPGYHRVGDSRCGSWVHENENRSWYWNRNCRPYGRYVGRYHGGSMSTRPILWGDWDSYRTHRRSRRADKPWFGSDGKTFGTKGTYAKKSNPTYFERQTRRVQQRKARFDQRSRARAGRGRGGRRGGK